MTEDPTLPPPSPVATLFVGADGLRAGWSLLLALLLYEAGVALCNTLLPLLWPVTPGRFDDAGRLLLTAATTLRDTLPTVVLLLAVTWLLSRAERRPFIAYGLGGSARIRHLLTGALSGAMLLSVLVATLALSHHLAFDHRLLSVAAIPRSAAAWAIAFLSVALNEELLLRGFLQFTLARGLIGLLRAGSLRHARPLGFFLAALLLSILFGAGHRGNPGESPVGLLAATTAGLVWCLALYRTGSLWWPIGFHAAWDWSQSFLFGVADSGTISAGRLFRTHPIGPILLSGGDTGPEGSLFVLPTLALAALVILLTVPRQAPAIEVFRQTEQTPS